MANEALEDALYGSHALRDFVGIDPSHESVPDATTLWFRRLARANDLTWALFDEINAHPAEQGLLMRAGTIVDATIIAAPSSTKNESKARYPEIHQTKKGSRAHDLSRARRRLQGGACQSGEGCAQFKATLEQVLHLDEISMGVLLESAGAIRACQRGLQAGRC